MILTFHVYLVKQVVRLLLQQLMAEDGYGSDSSHVTWRCREPGTPRAGDPLAASEPDVEPGHGHPHAPLDAPPPQLLRARLHFRTAVPEESDEQAASAAKRFALDKGGRPSVVRGPARTFRIRGRILCFTVSQCPVSPKDFYEALADKSMACASADIYIVQEKHQDGGLHLHGLVLTDKGKSLDISNIVKIGDKEWKMQVATMHKNYQGREKGWMEYMLKHEPTVDKGNLFMSPGASLEDLSEKQSDYDLILTATSEVDALSKLAAKHGDAFLRIAPGALAVLRVLHPAELYRLMAPVANDWNLTGVQGRLIGIKNWLARYVEDEGWKHGGIGRKPILYVSGPTNIGKTVALRLLTKNVLIYCSHRIHIDALLFAQHPDAPLVLDDLDDDMPGGEKKAPLKQWTQSTPYDYTCKYRKVTTVRLNRPVVIISNEEHPAWRALPYWQDNRNIVYCHCPDKLYR